MLEPSCWVSNRYVHKTNIGRLNNFLGICLWQVHQGIGKGCITLVRKRRMTYLYIVAGKIVMHSLKFQGFCSHFIFVQNLCPHLHPHVSTFSTFFNRKGSL